MTTGASAGSIRPVLTVILKQGFLRWMLVVGCAILFAFPVYDVAFVYPRFESLLVGFSEEEALRVGTHLMSGLNLDGRSAISAATLPPDVRAEAARMVADFRLDRMKIYGADGEIVYSSDEDEIGIRNDAPYFADQVMKGRVLTRAVPPSGHALEGRLLGIDVVETYVPIMRDGRFVGAFEIYYDIAARSHALVRLLARSVGISAVLAATLFVVLLVAVAKAAAAIHANAEAERKLRASEARLRNMTGSAQDAIIEIDGDGRVAFWNAAAERIFGISSADAVGRDLHRLVAPPSDHAGIAAALPAYRESGCGPLVGKTVELMGRRRDGSEFPVEISVAQLPCEEGRHAVGILRDITERKAVEQQLKLGERIVHHALSGIVVTDAEERIQVVNRAFTKVTGYAPEEVIGKRPSILKSGRHDADFYAAMWHALSEQGEWQGEVWNRRKNGEIYPEHLSISAIRDSQERPTHYVAIFSDISQQKEVERDLERLALHDPLTGLANRALFSERLGQCIREARRSQGRKFGVFYLDLDLFKEVNDRHGHEIGDLLLQEVAKRLSGTVRETDMVARLGGDEFAMIADDIQNCDTIAVIADKIIEAIDRPFVLRDVVCRIGTSVGVSIYPDDGERADLLVKIADEAMYEVKRSGRNRWQCAHGRNRQTLATLPR